jgi:hypothetical protein
MAWWHVSLGLKCEIGESLSAIGLFGIFPKQGVMTSVMIGVKELDPHNLRSTDAQLSDNARVPITRISKHLFHSSIAATPRYLDLDLDIEVSISDIFYHWND